jgi:hypothetical protein
MTKNWLSSTRRRITPLFAEWIETLHYFCTTVLQTTLFGSGQLYWLSKLVCLYFGSVVAKCSTLPFYIYLQLIMWMLLMHANSCNGILLKFCVEYNHLMDFIRSPNYHLCVINSFPFFFPSQPACTINSWIVTQLKPNLCTHS